jgi:chorismate mutase / prephenate dehydratase
MPRKPAADQKPVPPADTKRMPTLASLRSEIDRIDKELVALLNRRAEIALQIGQVKQKQGLEIWSPAREDEVLTRALAASRGPLPPETLRLIFRELMSGSRALQRPLRIACLGPKYSYSHLAAVAKFGEAVEHVPVGSIAAVFEEVNRRHVQFGLVPLENSTDGRIVDTLDMFVRLPGLKIRAEVRLRVHHCLIGRCEWGQVQRIYSKAQALSQCRHWIGKNLPQARTIDVVSTAAAAEHAKTEPFVAAVASRAAADAYGLNILAENIEDQPHNITRFAVIAETAEQRTGRDKTTLMLRLPNQVGSLAKAIAPFEKNGVNMTWIESFPTVEGTSDRDPTYLFFVDIEGHIEDEPVRRAMEAVRKRCERLEVLGSYPRGECVES